MIGKTNAIALSKGADVIELNIYRYSDIVRSGSSSTTDSIYIAYLDDNYSCVVNSSSKAKDIPLIHTKASGYYFVPGSDTSLYRTNADSALLNDIIIGTGLNNLPDGTYSVGIGVLSAQSTVSGNSYNLSLNNPLEFSISNGVVTISVTSKTFLYKNATSYVGFAVYSIDKLS